MSISGEASGPNASTLETANDGPASVAALPLRWSALVAPEGGGVGLGHDAAGARDHLIQALQGLLQWLSGHTSLEVQPVGASIEPEPAEPGSRSLLETIQALLALVQDPLSPLPSDFATALVLTQERLADLRLRQLLAAHDPQWSRRVLEPGPAEAPTTEPPRAPAPAAAVLNVVARDWWAVPVEGLNGSNQLFLIETRELLRSAELSLQALNREPGDYAEQMVLCRSFQAVAVAAASMGLHAFAQIAAEGEAQFDRLLEHGGLCDAEALRETDHRLQRLFRELMDLVGESVPAVPESEVPARSDGPGLAEPLVELPAEPVAETPSERPAAGPAEPPTVGTAESRTVAAALDPVGVADEALDSGVMEPAPSPAPAPQKAPWWWAMDWSAWPLSQVPSSGPHTSASNASADAEAPIVPALQSSESTVRLPSWQVQVWAQRLETQGHDATIRQAMVQAMEEAACLPLESWSVALFRTARRVARELGQTADFDIEGTHHRMDAALLQPVMMAVEKAVASRVEQAIGTPLRLRAQAWQGGVRLALGDGSPEPWREEVRASFSGLSAWLREQGGAGRSVSTEGIVEWAFDMPVMASRVPTLEVAAGAVRLKVPALWIVGRQTLDAESMGQALRAGVALHGDRDWPLMPLSALLRLEPGAQASWQVLFVDDGAQRLALLVEDITEVAVVRPLKWPAGLASLCARSGLWGAAQDARQRLCLVVDPLALQERFGPAAKVLVRSRARRTPRTGSDAAAASGMQVDPANPANPADPT